jgi:predicted metal-binding protein
MSELNKYIEKAILLGVSRAKIINTKDIAVGDWVRLKCQYGCGAYGDCLTCPPYSPTPDYTRKMLGEYSKGLLMQIEDISYKEESRISLKFKDIVAELEREIFLDGYYKAFGMTCGPCRFCQICDTSKPCKYPRKARPSMEACGIDVYQTAKNIGFKLEVVKSEDSLCSFISLILIE